MMKALLAVVLMAMMAGGAVADDNFATVGLFFSPDDSGYDWEETTNSEVVTASGFAGPFAWAYMVMMAPTMETIFYIEFGFKSEAWVEGWMTPHIYFGTPGEDLFSNVDGAGGYSAMWIWPNGITVDAAGTVLARFRLLNWVGDPSDIEMGPMRHLSPSIAGRMSAITFNDEFILLSAAVDWDEVDEDGYAVVATFFGAGVVATEDRTLSSVKSLFQ